MNTDQKILEKSILNHPAETISIIENFADPDIATFIENLPVELSVLVISKLSRFKAIRIFDKVPHETACQIIEQLPISIAKIILTHSDESRLKRILDDLPAQYSKPLKSTLKYPENSVGGFIDPLVFTLSEHDTVHQGLEKVKKSHAPIPQQIYLLKDNQSLAGYIEIQQLISMDANTQIKSIMHTELHKIKANMDISALKKQQWPNESFPFLPVVDSNGVFLGVLSKKVLVDIKPQKTATDQQALEAGLALGELYRIGLNSFVRGVAR